MDLGLKDKKVLITASSGGIGFATARTFLEEGAKVIINGKNEEKLNIALNDLISVYGKGRVDGFLGDVTDNKQIIKLKDYIENKYGSIDILISNLGSGKPLSKNHLDTNEWIRFLEINLLSSVKLTDQFIPVLEKQMSGSIIFISSIAGIERLPSPFGYAAAKSGLFSLTKCLSASLAEKNIRVNCIVPGNVFFEGGRWDELLKHNPDIESDYIKKEVPMKRFAKAEEIADSIVFVSSPKSSFTTGAVLVIDGGQTRSFL